MYKFHVSDHYHQTHLHRPPQRIDHNIDQDGE